MKPKLSVLLLTAASVASAAHANVGVFTGYGHSVELTSTADIQMVSEEVTIIPGRGPFLFDGGVPGMDRVEYDCTFVLRNQKDDAVSITAGFPLNSQFLSPPYDNNRKTSQLIAQYKFTAQEEDSQYSVRYVAGDKEKKLKNLFLWAMVFAPQETKTLRVTYVMPISATLGSTAIDRDSSKYGKPWYRNLEGCMLEWFGYVTETGRSWSGTIEKATFKVYVRGFEKYLAHRPMMEGAMSTKARERYPVWNPPALRIASPDGWEEDDRGFLTLSFDSYEADRG